MFEYKKVIKEIEKLESMVDVIINTKYNSGYRVQISFCNGTIYSETSENFLVDIFVIDDYQSANKQVQGVKLENISNHDAEVRLPCKIHGNPLLSNGVISSIKFNKEAMLEELKENEKYIVNPRLGTVEIPTKDNSVIIRHIIPSHIEVYFDEGNTKNYIENKLMAKTEIIEEFGVNPSYFDVSVNRGKLSPYIKKGKTNLYLREDVEQFFNQIEQ